ncbi:MAG TPA: right-handed parallel beta-helix repeat-containing protein [Polyangia bacterium]
MQPLISVCERPQRSKALVLLSAGVTCFCVFLAPGRAWAAEYYVSPTGSDSNPGTQGSPFATLQKGNDSAAAGDTVWMRAGTYNCTSQITLSKSGTSDTNRTKIWAYAGEVPILDFSNFSLASSSSDHPAITVTGSWMHLKGLEIANGKVGASGSHSYSMLRTKGASNNTFELLNIHHGFGPGLFIDTGTGGNLILNCDSHDNYDKDGSQGDGQNGDGFGVHYQDSGPSTIIRGCRAWHNSDDGYDFIFQEVPVTIENSWATGCGYGSGGNGNGFKIGSSATGVRHIVQNNVAWKNKASGFYANHSSGGNTWYNNTSYSNGTQYNMLAATFASDGTTIATDGITLTGSKVHIMRNNVGFPDKNANMNGVDTASNTWDLSIAEASSDFASTSDTGCTGPREADGSMPAACTFMQLKTGSPLIDKGKDVGLPFVGATPDLGAYEYGATTGTGGTGAGSGGSGGSTRNDASAGGNPGSGGSGGGTRSDASAGSSPGSGGGNGGTRSDASSGGNGGSAGSGGSATAGTTLTGGGTSGTGGSVASGTGGAAGAGGLLGTGGNQGSGGNMVSGAGGGANASGTGKGGAAGTGASGGSGGSTPGNAAGSNGCGCMVGSRSPHGRMTAFLILGALALRARRRLNR